MRLWKRFRSSVKSPLEGDQDESLSLDLLSNWCDAVQSFEAIVISLPIRSPPSSVTIRNHSPPSSSRLIDNDDVSHRLFGCPLNMIEIQIDPMALHGSVDPPSDNNNVAPHQSERKDRNFNWPGGVMSPKWVATDIYIDTYYVRQMNLHYCFVGSNLEGQRRITLRKFPTSGKHSKLHIRQKGSAFVGNQAISAGARIDETLCK